MHIAFTPIRHDKPLTAAVAGDVLTLNGEAFDFAALPEGATLPRDAVSCDWLASEVERIEGQIHLTLLLPHGPNAPDETRFPASIIVTGGIVPIPVHNVVAGNDLPDEEDDA
ncbi:hypothetical protein J7426_23615 [Tropicibacter sp. R16_0]|uniref:hypothetical protein n=1 Tax=Tropicibacter sp. R16_0 TaxID=2821102 RepID=UPI001ADC9A18|nr:hypothetical protein [Tropicibacter sp. R16_0]MBO9453269.1 hypothetical protein [Tropicibacter sp. R16_0]